MKMQMHAGGDAARILHHIGQEFAKQRVIHLIDLEIALAHILGQGGVALDIVVQRVLHHPLDGHRHPPQGHARALDHRQIAQHIAALGDVLGVIAHAVPDWPRS